VAGIELGLRTISARPTFGASTALRLGFGDVVSAKAEFLYNFLYNGEASLHLPQFQLSLVVALGTPPPAND